jgi:hypothetical protein
MTYITHRALIRRINLELANHRQKLRYHNRSGRRHDPEFVPYFDVARVFTYLHGEAVLARAEGPQIRDDDRALVRFARELGIRGVAVIPHRTCEKCEVLPATIYEPDWRLSLCRECSRELHAVDVAEQA